MHKLPKKGEPGYPGAPRVRQLAGMDMTPAMIGVHFDLTQEEFTSLLAKDRDLKRAYEFGQVEAKVAVKREIWESKTPVMTFLRARCVLKMEDPVVEAVAGDTLKLVLMKLESSDRKSLGKVLGFNK